MTLSRRHFLATSSSAALYALLAEHGLLAQAAAPMGPVITDIRRNVATFALRGGTIAILNTTDGLAIVDTQYADTATACLKGIREKTPRTIDLVVNTHHHGDHTLGNGVFRAAARRLVAHENSAALQRKAASAPQTGGAAQVPPTYPDATYTNTWSETVGDETIALRYFGPGHTSGDSVVTFEKANVVHMGDLVFNRMHGFVDVDSGASITNWATLLDQVVKAHTAETKYIFGHGDKGQVIGTQADLLEFRDYLQALMTAAREAVKKGTPRDEFTTGSLGTRFASYGSPVPGNANFSLPGNLGKAWDEASKK